MIRDFRQADIEQIDHLIKHIDTGYEIDNSIYIQANALKILVHEQDTIKGLAYAIVSTNDANEKEMQIRMYVEPQSRNKGIGTALYNELERNLNGFGADILTAYIKTECSYPSSFCHKMGFEKWWGSPELLYTGDNFPDVNLKMKIYEDTYFEQYVKVVQESYFELHKANDLKPYIVTKDIVLKYKLNNIKNVFIAIENDQIVASVTIGKGTIDNLMVSPDFQGKGYGKQALQFGVNELLNQGYDDIHICYMEGNTSAENLYTSIGFKHLHTTHVFRKFAR